MLTTTATRPDWQVIATRTVHEFRIHQCWDLAAALTYYVVLTVCPALLAAAALLGVFGSADEVARGALAAVRDLGGEDVASALTEPLDQLLNASRAGLALATGLVVTLWTVSGYLGTFGRGMNRILGVPEGRPFWKSRPAMLGAAAVLVVLGSLVAVALVVSGNVATAMFRALGIDDGWVLIWDLAKLPFVAVLAGLMLAVLYWAAPNVRRPRRRWISVGAGVALAVWIMTTVLFGLYVWNFASYDRVYGVLGGILAFLLWTWLGNMAVLVGAVLDSEVERARQLRAGIPAQEALRLELRDERLVHLNREQREADIRASARMLAGARQEGAG
ncbi:YihY/virulence factor BrkB family protein [Agromyces indicus]|uniref:YihY/virulence factor BrkB family protein n=1 Tax=Agromyces indicus TaxID=758919 RepID=A0ABU1FMA1_9MICO|nr:YihY/virulence factor BrkB family protein [Agromyces indicus]MDR5692868.1 YihY/virulence factor BrkB family protein [Agromyces indicus]